jgi:hypothetical protein
MHYTATNQNYSTLEVTNEQSGTIGRLECNTWVPKKARIIINNGNTYDVVPAGGFWRSLMSITKNGVAYAELRATPGANITLTFANGLAIIFTRKSIWSGGYIMTDNAENEIASIEANFIWRKFSYQYEMEINANMPDREADLFLPFILLYCTRYMRMRGAAV